MAGVARSVIAQAPAAIGRRRAWIDDTGCIPDGVFLAREKYNGCPAPDMWNLRTVSLLRQPSSWKKNSFFTSPPASGEVHAIVLSTQ